MSSRSGESLSNIVARVRTVSDAASKISCKAFAENRATFRLTPLTATTSGRISSPRASLAQLRKAQVSDITLKIEWERSSYNVAVDRS